MTNAEEELQKETRKWLGKAKKEFQAAAIKDGSKADLFRNARNYIRDCEYFIDKDDWVRAFEAVIYAYGILDTLKRIGAVEIEEK